MERTILPSLASEEFGLSSNTLILSFIVAFGLTKAMANYFTGRWANRFGRKRLLIAGWLFGLPIPFMLIFAPDWSWVVAANVLLGINQGLAWSSNVIMKIDLVGEKNRGLAMGFNEFAGYLAVGIAAWLTGFLAAEYGVRPVPFYLGIAFSWLGLILSVVFVKDTQAFVKVEAKSSPLPMLSSIFRDTSYRHRNLGSVTQAGLINNFNDGMVWGLLPIFLGSKLLGDESIGLITATYPAVWGIGQLFTGKLGDIASKRKILSWGLLLQGIAILFIPGADAISHFLILSGILGAGTALVYPNFLAAIADNTHPTQRAEALGIFRMWRDLGYAFGAIATGIIADVFNIESAILFVGLITLISGVVVYMRMRD